MAKKKKHSCKTSRYKIATPQDTIATGPSHGKKYSLANGMLLGDLLL